MAKFKTLSISIMTLIAGLMLWGCGSTHKTATTGQKGKIKIENFDQFYNRFHTDSLFQLSRIKHPLQGKLVDGTESGKWTKENWMLMKTRIYDIDTTQFKTSYQKTDVSFVQKVWIENSGFSSECRFEVLDGKWYLTYVLDQNL
jgi:hypothetical protein